MTCVQSWPAVTIAMVHLNNYPYVIKPTRLHRTVYFQSLAVDRPTAAYTTSIKREDPLV